MVVKGALPLSHKKKKKNAKKYSHLHKERDKKDRVIHRNPEVIQIAEGRL